MVTITTLFFHRPYHHLPFAGLNDRFIVKKDIMTCRNFWATCSVFLFLVGGLTMHIQSLRRGFCIRSILPGLNSCQSSETLQVWKTEGAWRPFQQTIISQTYQIVPFLDLQKWCACTFFFVHRTRSVWLLGVCYRNSKYWWRRMHAHVLSKLVLYGYLSTKSSTMALASVITLPLCWNDL